MGSALAPLREQNIAIIGSGSPSFHHIRSLRSGEANTPSFQHMYKRWSKTLEDAVGVSDVKKRKENLMGWKQWEGSAQMHPDGASEHFSPLVVCAGAAGEGIAKGWNDALMGLGMRSFYWE